MTPSERDELIAFLQQEECECEPYDCHELWAKEWQRWQPVLLKLARAARQTPARKTAAKKAARKQARR